MEDKANEPPRKEELVEEIGKIFEGQGPYSEDFSVNELSNPSGSAVWKPGYLEDHSEAQTRDIPMETLRVRDTDLFCKLIRPVLLKDKEYLYLNVDLYLVFRCNRNLLTG